MIGNGGNNVYINLLPKEIIDKRKGERRLALALLAAVGIGAVLFAFFAVNMVRISGKENVIRGLEKENTNYTAAIDGIKSFQDKQNQVDQREKLIDSVSNVKFSWSRFLNDVSLIIPNDVWLTKINSDGSLITFEGSAKSDTSETLDIGHKLVAKWLVHLDQIDGLSDVWLASSDKDKTSDTIKFTSSAKIIQPVATVSAPAVPAPPTSGQTGGGSQ